MQRVYLDYNGIKARGFLLATFDIASEPKKRVGFFPFKKNAPSSSRHYCIVFIPWKHREKEIALIETKEMSFCKPYDEKVIAADEFISPFTAEAPYYSELKIKCFIGYKFIFDTKSFISNVNEQCFSSPLELLYRNLPELLNEELDEE